MMQKTNQATIDSVAQVFVANTLRSNTTYVKSLRDHYKADVSSQDFTSPAVAANNINSWIRTRTKALISDLISEGNTLHYYLMIAQNSVVTFVKDTLRPLPCNNYLSFP